MASTNQSDIQLRIVALIDGLVEIAKLTSEVDALGGQTAESSGKVEQLVTELDRLRKQDQLIDQFQTLKRETSGLSGTLDDARARATSLGKGLSDSKKAVAESNSEYKASKTATQALADEWRLAKLHVDQLAKGIKESNAPTKEQRSELKAARAEAKQLGDQYRESARTTAELASGLSSAEKALKQQTREFNAARKEVNLLDSQYIKQSGTLNGLRTQLQQSGLNTKQLAAEQRALKEATSNAEQTVSQLADELRSQATEQRLVNSQLKAGEKQLTEYKQAAEKAKNSTGELTGKTGGFSSSVAALTGRLVALAGAYLGLQTIKDALVSIFDSGDKAEQLSIQMNAVMGSIAGGEQATSWIKKFAKDTPLQLNEVTETFVRLKAMGLDPMDGTMQAVIDQSAKLGLSFDGVQSISLALGQAWAKGKLQGDDMLQMTERGVPVMELLSKATGQSTYELSQMSEKGLLGRDAIRALIAEMGSQAAGSASSQMGTMTGLLSNLGDSWEEFKRSIADAGALDWAKNQLKELSSAINEMAADGRLQQYAKQVSDWLVSTGESTKRFVLSIGGSFDGLVAGTTFAVESLRVVFNLFTGTVKYLATALLAPTYAMAKMLDAVAKVADAMGLNGLAGQIRNASGLMKAEFNAFATATQEDMDDIIDAAGKMAGGHQKATDSIVNSMQRAEKETANSVSTLQQHYLGLEKSASDAASAVADVFAKAGLDLQQASGKVGKTVTDYVNGLDTISSSAERNGFAIQAYLAKAFDSTKNKAEIDAVIQKMQQLHDNGALVGAPYIDSLAKATAAAKSLSSESTEGAALYISLLSKQKAAADEAYKAGTISADAHKQKVGELNKEIAQTTKAQRENAVASDALASSYSDLGIQSAAALDAIASKQKTAYEEIQRSGASLDIQRQAFLAYAEAELKAAQASDRYADGALSATAASLGLSKEFAALQQSTASVGSEALITAGALDTLSGSADNAAASMSNAAKRSKELQDASTSAAEGAGAASAFMSDYTTNLQKSLRELSPQAEHMMTNMLGISSSTASASSAIDTLTQKLDANYAQWKRISMSVTLDDIQGRIKEVGEAYLMSERAYLQQAIAAEQMKEQLSSANGVTAQTIKYAESLANGMDMLDAQTLSGLRSAIDSAREKMQSLESSAKSTLNSLRDELDQYNNNLDAVEQRRYESQIADIQAKLDEAQAMKDQTAVRDYQEALDLANKLHQKKMQDIADEAAAAKKNQQSNVATDTTLTNTVTTQSAATQAATPTEVIQINLPNGSTATVSADKTNSTALKDILQQLQLHALRS